MGKKTFSFGHCPNEGEGRAGLPMPEFFGPFQEVHFWSIKGVYLFQNANVFNFCNSGNARKKTNLFS